MKTIDFIKNGAYLAGERAYLDGVPAIKNPFQYSSNKAKQAWWSAGWHNAARDYLLENKKNAKSA